MFTCRNEAEKRHVACSVGSSATGFGDFLYRQADVNQLRIISEVKTVYKMLVHISLKPGSSIRHSENFRPVGTIFYSEELYKYRPSPAIPIISLTQRLKRCFSILCLHRPVNIQCFGRNRRRMIIEVLWAVAKATRSLCLSLICTSPFTVISNIIIRRKLVS